MVVEVFNLLRVSEDKDIVNPHPLVDSLNLQRNIDRNTGSDDGVNINIKRSETRKGKRLTQHHIICKFD